MSTLHPSVFTTEIPKDDAITYTEIIAERRRTGKPNAGEDYYTWWTRHRRKEGEQCELSLPEQSQ